MRGFVYFYQSRNLQMVSYHLVDYLITVNLKRGIIEISEFLTHELYLTSYPLLDYRSVIN